MKSIPVSPLPKYITATAIALSMLLIIWNWLPPAVHGGEVVPTNRWVDFYSANSTSYGQPLPVGAIVAVYDHQGVKCGEFVVSTAGQYGIMPCYADDPATPEDEGATEGDPLHFTINGEAATAQVVSHNSVPLPPATEVTWSQAQDRWQVNLQVPALYTATPTPTPVSQRFIGYTYLGPAGDTSFPFAGVITRLYGRNQGDAPPGVLLQTRNSGPLGFWDIRVVGPPAFDFYRVIAEPPPSASGTGAWSEDGTVLSPTEIEWFQPVLTDHFSRFFLDFPTVTPTPTPTPTPTSTPTPISQRFIGYTYLGAMGETNFTLSGVITRLYGRNQGDAPPGVLLQTRNSGPLGFWDVRIVGPPAFDFYRVIAEPPSGMSGTGAWSEDGTVLSPTEIEWFRPAYTDHFSRFFVNLPTVTPTYTPTPTHTPTPTPTPSPTPTDIRILAFTAKGLASGIAISWRTALEPQGLHFVVERLKAAPGADFIPVSPEIPGEGDYHTYAFLDSSALPGVAYLYRLAILPTGQHTLPVGPATRPWSHFLPMMQKSRHRP